ncbi:hypothetical protein GBF38_010477 [Nibea albiflora]|uniref:Uncharacterized protein n=1 Tax=Nibea albiflora TaxID=240163 RepID=A0ACB7F3X2_NIBAL|nr:hypothetical protein GBF38_010477 [Nibea albiflora]
MQPQTRFRSLGSKQTNRPRLEVEECVSVSVTPFLHFGSAAPVLKMLVLLATMSSVVFSPGFALSSHFSSGYMDDITARRGQGLVSVAVEGVILLAALADFLSSRFTFLSGLLAAQAETHSNYPDTKQTRKLDIVSLQRFTCMTLQARPVVGLTNVMDDEM